MDATGNLAKEEKVSHGGARRSFIPADVGQNFSETFFDEAFCRDWILAAIHGRGERYCPACRAQLTGIASARFSEGKRICCRSCGKYFTALTGTFLGGGHLSFREVVLLAVLLYFKIPLREIARILRISIETIRLWEVKFHALERLKSAG